MENLPVSNQVQNEIPEIDQFITVLKWLSHTDYSYVSDILKVKAVDYPFVVVNRLNKFNDKHDVIKLDLRRIEFKKLSLDYVHAYLNQ